MKTQTKSIQLTQLQISHTVVALHLPMAHSDATRVSPLRFGVGED